MAATTNEFIGTGRRKTAVARVRLATGSGKILINGRALENYFTTEILRGVVTQPFTITQTINKFDTRVNVAGGGPPGKPVPCGMASPAHCWWQIPIFAPR